MFDTLGNIFSTGNFIPHGHCYLWQPALVFLHVISDSIIALSYYSIPLLLIYFIQKRRDFPFHWILFLFSAFILSCGTDHLFEIWVLWHPHYWLFGFSKAITAIISALTAIQLVWIIPKALALPSPKELEAANQALQDEIIERKKVEKELLHLKDNLEKLVEKRTQELAKTNSKLEEEILEREQYQKQLSNSLLEIESINQELNDFAYIISHDLKAPLRGIQHIANWLVEDYQNKLDEEGKKLINLLIHRVETMQQLIDGVLQYSRVGRIKEEVKKVDLNQLVPQVIDLLSPPPHIHIDIANSLPFVIAEETRIKQLFQNLLSNALKFIDKPQGIIRIDVSSQEEVWKFSISDNGRGIETKNLSKIFQIFQKFTTDETENESTGIGLSVVKKIVELYGGAIWVESETEKGSTFWFTLAKSAC